MKEKEVVGGRGPGKAYLSETYFLNTVVTEKFVYWMDQRGAGANLRGLHPGVSTSKKNSDITNRQNHGGETKTRWCQSGGRPRKKPGKKRKEPDGGGTLQEHQWAWGKHNSKTRPSQRVVMDGLGKIPEGKTLSSKELKYRKGVSNTACC